MIFQNKKANLFGAVMVVIITLIVFFSLFPAVDALLDVAVSTQTDSSIIFMIQSVTFIILLGVISWVYSSISEA